MPHVRSEVPFLGPESRLKLGFACTVRASSVYRFVQLPFMFLPGL